MFLNYEWVVLSFPLLMAICRRGKGWPHPNSALLWQNYLCWASLVLFLRHAGSHLVIAAMGRAGCLDLVAPEPPGLGFLGCILHG